VLEDAILGSGGKEYFFPKGSTLWVPVTIVHRDEEVYEEPLKFKPDRFLKIEHEKDENGKDVEKLTRKVLFNKRGKPTRMSHLPFGGGKSMVFSPNFLSGWRANCVVPWEEFCAVDCFDICGYFGIFL